MVVWGIVWMIVILLISVAVVIYYIMRMIISGQMTKKKEREYAKDRQEYFREFHRVIAPVVVMKKYDE